MTSDPDLPWKLYRASLKHGDPAKVAEELGLKPTTLKQLMAEEPVLQRAADAAQADRLPAAFHDLSDESKGIWEALNNPAATDVKQAALIAMADKGERERKRLLAWGLLQNNFDVSSACRNLKIGIRQFELWVKNDPEFAEMIAEIQSAKRHFVEGRLFALVAAGSEKAIMFSAERLMRDQYGKVVEHTGTINHAHSSIDLGRLPVAVKAQIFELLENAGVITPDGMLSYDAIEATEVKRLT